MGKSWRKYLNLKEIVEVDSSKPFEEAIKFLKKKKNNVNYTIYLETIAFIYDKKIEEIKKIMK